jgi:hypothetical protein
MNEDDLRHEKTMADIARLIAETKKIGAQTEPEVAKLIAETKKISSENQWYPFVVGATVTLAIVAVVKIFL